jgi:hypothetical protein
MLFEQAIKKRSVWALPAWVNCSKVLSWLTGAHKPLPSTGLALVAAGRRPRWARCRPRRGAAGRAPRQQPGTLPHEPAPHPQPPRVLRTMMTPRCQRAAWTACRCSMGISCTSATQLWHHFLLAPLPSCLSNTDGMLAGRGAVDCPVRRHSCAELGGHQLEGEARDHVLHARKGVHASRLSTCLRIAQFQSTWHCDAGHTPCLLQIEEDPNKCEASLIHCVSFIPGWAEKNFQVGDWYLS